MPSQNPIIPGFHPDPSICRVDDDYYLATSSFEYLPGVPIFHSRDLINWELIGNAFDTLELPSSTGSSGIYAPTLRHHNGRFWLVTTNVSRFTDGHLLSSATDPRGPWSEPIHLGEAVGIDPDLSWDDAGVCHLSWSAGAGETRIVQARLDLKSGRLISEPCALMEGPGLAHAEAPHVIRRGDWWYLLLAEGGTNHGHSVTVARSRSIDGPYESYPSNPILTHRSTALAVQNTGHADLVQTPAGEWAMVYLGVRPRGRSPKWHVNGRETFLAGVTWVDDWPVVDEARFVVPTDRAPFEDSLRVGPLPPRWVAPGVQPRELVTWTPAGVVVAASSTHPDARPLLAIRTEHPEWSASVTVGGESARLTVRLDEEHWAAVELGADALRARVVIGPVAQVLAEAPRPAAEVRLAIRAIAPPPGLFGASAPDLLQFGYETADGFTLLASIDGRYLSTEVAGGFTGRVVGIEPAEGERATTPVRDFSYAPLGLAG